jgi:2-iminobutanoate/2-iminopropanoate deaminase
MANKASVIQTNEASQAIGPYSQAIQLGTFIFTSGQIPLNLEGQIVEGGIKEQTEQVIQNLKAIVERAGSSLDKVIKTTVFLKDMNDFQTFNHTYERYFGITKPARSTVEVARLPKDVMVEIECVAYVD